MFPKFSFPLPNLSFVQFPPKSAKRSEVADWSQTADGLLQKTNDDRLLLPRQVAAGVDQEKNKAEDLQAVRWQPPIEAWVDPVGHASSLFEAKRGSFNRRRRVWWVEGGWGQADKIMSVVKRFLLSDPPKIVPDLNLPFKNRFRRARPIPIIIKGGKIEFECVFGFGQGVGKFRPSFKGTIAKKLQIIAVVFPFRCLNLGG